MPNETSEEAKVQDAQTQRVAAAPAASAGDAVRLQICTTGQTGATTAAHHSSVGSTGQRLVSVVPQVASPSVLVVAKVPTAGLCTTGQPLRFTRPSSSPATSVKTPAPGRTVVMAVPRTTAPQPLAPRPSPTTSTQLPANFQIPPGMVLIRSDSGQLMLVSQQTLAQAQAQQAQKANSVPASRLPGSRLPAPMSAAAPGAKAEKLMVIRVAAPPSTPTPTTTTTTTTTTITAAAGLLNTTGLNKEAPKPVVQPLNTGIAQAGFKQPTGSKQPMFTITQETLENVKKCKNFLVTLIKLASSGSQSPDMAANVKALVRSLLDGSLEPEEFTNKLYVQLKSTPQPYLVPFLKKSLPAVRHLTADPQHFIQQAGQPKPQPAPPAKPTLVLGSTATKPSGSLTGGRQTLKHLDKYPRGVTLGPVVAGPSTHLRTGSFEGSRTTPRGLVVLSGQQHPGVFSFKRPSVPHQPTTSYAFKDTSYKEDDDINDVASMAGVNLKEESVRILASGGTAVGSVVQSCLDMPFLSPGALHARVLRAGQALGVSEARPEVVALVSNATQEFLRDLLEKLSLAAEHRKSSLKVQRCDRANAHTATQRSGHVGRTEDGLHLGLSVHLYVKYLRCVCVCVCQEDHRYTKVTDVRSQLHFLEQVEVLKRRRQEEEQRETLLRLARRRSNSEDPQQQLLRQRAKEMQQVEQAQLQQREANLAALAAIGPRKRRPLDSTGNMVSVMAKSVVTRVTMRDLVLCMEEDHRMRHSLTLYKALMR